MKTMIAASILALFSVTVQAHDGGNSLVPKNALVYEQNIDDDGTAIVIWVEVTNNLAIRPCKHDPRIAELDVVTNLAEQEGIRVCLYDKDTMFQKTLRKDPNMKLQFQTTPLDGGHVENHKERMGEAYLLQCQKEGFWVGYNARLVPMDTPLPGENKTIGSADYPDLTFFKYEVCEIPAVIKFEKLTKAPGMSQILAPIVENSQATDRGRYALIFGKDTMYTAFTRKQQNDKAVMRVLPMSNAEIFSYQLYADTLAAKTARQLTELAAEIAQEQEERAAAYDTLRKGMSRDERKEAVAEEAEMQESEAQELADAQARGAQKVAEAYALVAYMKLLQSGKVDPKDPKPRYRIFSWEVKESPLPTTVAPAPAEGSKLKNPAAHTQGNTQTTEPKKDVTDPPPPAPSDTVQTKPKPKETPKPDPEVADDLPPEGDDAPAASTGNDDLPPE